ncbi:MAG: phosphoenolpyruvate synthase [Candidatus Bathyarchaeia archaeon]|nr:phosphoenolpyruvate synthase [Candidatus Bathyarchaeota archaeon]
MSEKKGKRVLWFDEIGIEDVPLVGGKSASLGEMTRRTGVPVPYGFATTAEAYRYYVKANRLDEKIAEILKELKDPNDTQTLQRVGARIRSLIASAEMPKDLEEEIVKAYERLAEIVGEKDPFVAVRSSATAEDLPDASFAGQQETYLNVHGANEVVEKIKHCYASLFTDRAIFYRIQKGFDHMAVALSAVVQLMVYSKASGVIFTLDVATGDRSVVLIEAGYGLGEYVVQGKITPDEYYVRKSDLEIVKKNISKKTVQLLRLPTGGTKEVPVPPELQDKQVLTDEQIKELAKYAIEIEKHYGKPMDIEWALDERTNKLFILQARPETVWALKKAEVVEEKPAVTKERKVLVQGLPASPGIAVGRVHIIPTVDRINEFQKGEILVTEMTAPDWVPAMRKAAAIITNSGGMTCHAAIVSRELGIPCIVGTASRGTPATEVLKDGMMVTVDAKLGVVYEGILEEYAEKPEKVEAAPTAVTVAEPYIITGTKVYVNLGEPELAEKVAALPADGVGLLRQEFVWSSEIGEHPLYMIETGRAEEFVNKLAEAFRRICAAFYPRPVVMRFSDFKSSEYRELKGGEKYEPVEPSALLGWRGASRYYDPKYIEAFRLEVRAVKKVREEYGLKNLWVMIPFCRRVDELEKIIKIMEEEGLRRGPDFKVWLMAEIPSNCLLADKFNKYIDGYSIGSNDLTMTILGCDRDNETVAHLFDERDLAVKRAIRLLIKLAHRDGKTVSICGQAPSVYPEFTEFLVRSGIDSISVNPDVVVQTRKLVASIEQRIMVEKATGRGMREDPDLDIPLDDKE